MRIILIALLAAISYAQTACDVSELTAKNSTTAAFSSVQETANEETLRSLLKMTYFNAAMTMALALPVLLLVFSSLYPNRSVKSILTSDSDEEKVVNERTNEVDCQKLSFMENTTITLFQIHQ
jgi:hypothetical protein